MEFFAPYNEFNNMARKNRGVKKGHQTKNLKFANGFQQVIKIIPH